MKRKYKQQTEIQTIDNLSNTGNEHVNLYAQKTVTECIRTQIFPDALIPLDFYFDSINILCGNNSYFEAIEKIITNMQENKFTDKQQYFIFKRLFDFFENSRFGEWNKKPCMDLMIAHIEILRKKTTPLNTKTKDVRELLQSIILNEIESLPLRLETMDAEKRLNFVCKLMPYVFPKVETIEPSEGECENWYD